MDADKILKEVKETFYRYYDNDKNVSRLYNRVRDGTATYTDAGKFSVRCGNALAKSYAQNIEDTTFTYDEAMQLLRTPLKNNHSLITNYCNSVQESMNTKAGMKVNPITPELDESRLEGLAKAISESEDALTTLKLFGESIINFSQAIVDDAVRENAGFASDLGFSPKIIREYEGAHDERGESVDCEYCLALAGEYDYEDVKSGNSDVYKRHEGCRCTITYVNGKNSSKMRTSGHAFVK